LMSKMRQDRGTRGPRRKPRRTPPPSARRADCRPGSGRRTFSIAEPTHQDLSGRRPARVGGARARVGRALGGWTEFQRPRTTGDVRGRGRTRRPGRQARRRARRYLDEQAPTDDRDDDDRGAEQRTNVGHSSVSSHSGVCSHRDAPNWRDCIESCPASRQCPCEIRGGPRPPWSPRQ